MIRAVFDTNLLVSGFLSRDNPGGVSHELLRFAREGTFQLLLSPEIIAETLATLTGSERAQQRYGYTPTMAARFCNSLFATATIVVDPPLLSGAVPRDPDDDKIIACAAAADAQYLVTRDDDMLSLQEYGSTRIISPEEFLHILRQQQQRDTPIP